MIDRGDLEGRIDPYYYKYEFLQNEYILNKIGYKKLAHYSKIVTKGETPADKLNDYTNKDNGIPFLKVLNFNEYGFKLTNLDYITTNKHNQMRRSQLNGDEILYSMAGTIGIAVDYNYQFKDANINQAIAKIVLNDITLNKFIVYILNTKLCRLQAKRFLTVSAQPNINFEQIKSIKIPLLNITTQKQVIDIMDNAYKVKEQKENKVKELIESIDDYLLDILNIKLPQEPKDDISNRIFRVEFDDVISDRMDASSYSIYYKNIFKAFDNASIDFVKLRNITLNIKTGTTPNQKLKPFVNDTKAIPFLRNSDIQDGEIIKEKFKYVKNELENNLIYSYKEDIIICIAGTIGISALNKFDRLAINQNVSSISIDKSKVNVEFITYWLNTKVAINLLKRLASIATISYVNNPTLLNLQIPLPPLEIQDKIAKEITSIRVNAKILKDEALNILANAKKEVERIILK